MACLAPSAAGSTQASAPKVRRIARFTIVVLTDTSPPPPLFVPPSSNPIEPHPSISTVSPRKILHEKITSKSSSSSHRRSNEKHPLRQNGEVLARAAAAATLVTSNAAQTDDVKVTPFDDRFKSLTETNTAAATTQFVDVDNEKCNHPENADDVDVVDGDCVNNNIDWSTAVSSSSTNSCCAMFTDASTSEHHDHGHHQDQDNHVNLKSALRSTRSLSLSSNDKTRIRHKSSSSSDDGFRPRKVSFSDEIGKPLATVINSTTFDQRRCSDGDVHARTTNLHKHLAAVRARLTEQASCGHSGEHWLCDFEQPIGDFDAFRQRLSIQAICVENVLIRHPSCHVIGTVRVRNLCYHKYVFVRVTFDQWNSHVDYAAKYEASGGGEHNCHQYDTFRFEFEMPRPSHETSNEDKQTTRSTVEFCAAFRLDNGQELWDNNDGQNYRLMEERTKEHELIGAEVTQEIEDNEQQDEDVMEVLADLAVQDGMPFY